MKKIILLSLSVLMFATSCSKTSDADLASESSDRLNGIYDVAGCLINGSDSNKMIGQINNGTISLIIRLYVGSTTCTGSYILTSDGTTPTSTPVPYANYTIESVANIPHDYTILAVTPVGGGSTSYSITFFASNGNQYGIAGYTSSLGSNWSDWTADVDIAGFISNPQTYVPITSGINAFINIPITEL